MNPLPKKVDFFDGVEKKYTTNDFDVEYFTDDREFEYCHNVNTSGNCIWYSLSDND